MDILFEEGCYRRGHNARLLKSGEGPLDNHSTGLKASSHEEGEDALYLHVVRRLQTLIVSNQKAATRATDAAARRGTYEEDERAMKARKPITAVKRTEKKKSWGKTTVPTLTYPSSISLVESFITMY
jgi:hypothetical protein